MEGGGWGDWGGWQRGGEGFGRGLGRGWIGSGAGWLKGGSSVDWWEVEGLDEALTRWK